MSVRPSVRPFVRLSLTVFPSYLIYYAIWKSLRSYYAEHNVWSYDMEEGEGVHIIGSSYAVGKSTYADHNVWSYNGRGGGVKNCLG